MFGGCFLSFLDPNNWNKFSITILFASFFFNWCKSKTKNKTYFTRPSPITRLNRSWCWTRFTHLRFLYSAFQTLTFSATLSSNTFSDCPKYCKLFIVTLASIRRSLWASFTFWLVLLMYVHSVFFFSEYPSDYFSFHSSVTSSTPKFYIHKAD